MSDFQNLTITSSGLSRVASELVNQRIYDSSLINRHGNLLITSDGVASLFSTTSYPSYSGFNLSEATSLRIKFVGSFYTAVDNSYQCCWSLSGTSDINETLSFYIKSGSISLFKGNNSLFSIEDINLDIIGYIDVDVILTESSCTIALESLSGAKTFTRELNTTLSLFLYTEVSIGWSSFNTDAFWVDHISLKDFVIFKNGLMAYSPSQDAYFNFEKVLISDGTYSLADNSYPILNHVYEIPIESISRTGNAILIKIRVENDVYLKISEIGLYCLAENNNSFLFSRSSGFIINKSSDLDYDLILKVDLTTKVVNTIAFPDIEVKSLKFLTKQDVDNAAIIHADIVTDMERAITNNSEIIGGARALVVNELISNSDECQRNVNAVQTYKTLINKFSLESVTDFYSFSTYPYPYSLYYAKNLTGSENSKIQVLEGAITGKRDNIDFSSLNGFSLCVKANFQNTEDKVILAKIVDKEESGHTVYTPYFSLELKGLALIFKIYTNDVNNKVVTLSKFFTALELNNILRGDYLVTITCEKTSAGYPYFKMYGNSELLVSVESGTNKLRTNLSQYFFSNYLSDSDLSETNYVSNIVSFNKTLTQEEVRFISTVLGTNN